MKKLISFIILTFSLFLLNSYLKANDNVEHGGRCTGSAYCSACSNCSRCGHCSGGGTCGVCGGGSSGRSSSSGRSNKKVSLKNTSLLILINPQKQNPVNPQKYLLMKLISILIPTTGTLQE
ncbi:hypothetical protein [Chryseobacterium sp. CH1]|uniref:hypothetical protein n=1 Tax=Chryseobacterium sp. CH1 TaxID=713551 RepID=UPI00100B5837|nr:hypothetical protein [Chryseobacterium sp. CH1]RXM62690.1 hypothetical protein BOQ60_19765 [Chryseobacterium sp. CH1]